MQLRTAKKGACILTVWIGCGGAIGLWPMFLLGSRFAHPWWLFAAVLTAVLAAVLIVYPKRYLRSIAIRLDGSILQIESGVVWHSRQSVPLSSLRAVRIVQSPLERHFDCAHMWLGFTGGMALLPFVMLPDAKRFRQYWESC